MKKYVPGIVGWAVVLGTVVACDVWLVRHKHPTMSNTLGAGLRRRVLGPVLAGCWGGLSYHLLVNEVLPKVAARAVTKQCR